MPYTNPPPRAYREVDLFALRRNFFALRAAAPHARVCPVLKANAYGHGARCLAPLYEKWGAAALAFATAEEAHEARAAGVKIPLLLLGHAEPTYAPDLAAAGIIPAAHSPESARELSAAATRAGVLLPVQVKLDTGMGRIGFVVRAGREAACAVAVREAARLPSLRAVGLFTHFSSADECGVGIDYTKKQLNRFLVVHKSLARAGLVLPAHAANSAATLALPEAHLDMIRPGLALFGISPFAEGEGLAPFSACYPDPPTVTPSPVGEGGPRRVAPWWMRRSFPACPLTPALAVKATVAQVKWVGRGDAIGYGRTFTAPRAMRVATVTVGYADGLFRRAAETGGGVVADDSKAGGGSKPPPYEGEGVFLPFVGRISMDACTVDATAAPWLRAGDTVTVLGGGGRVSFSSAAAREGTIPYELLVRLSPRLSTVYTGE